MDKRAVLVALLLISSLMLTSGCGTAKGMATGVGATAMGVADDTKGLWQGITRLDDWIKNKLW